VDQVECCANCGEEIEVSNVALPPEAGPLRVWWAHRRRRAYRVVDGKIGGPDGTLRATPEAVFIHGVR
jgi:hypothetical protein